MSGCRYDLLSLSAQSRHTIARNNLLKFKVGSDRRRVSGGEAGARQLRSEIGADQLFLLAGLHEGAGVVLRFVQRFILNCEVLDRDTGRPKGLYGGS